MLTFLPEPPVFIAFIIASLLLAVFPGPGVFYILGRSISGGMAAGFASVIGIFVGNFINMLAAVLGIAALFQAWPLSFVLVKYAGAAYLVFLAREAVRKKPQSVDAIKHVSHKNNRRLFVDGMLVAIFNPKTLMFFAAFLPQFLPVQTGVVPALLLGGIFVVIALLTDSAYAVMGAWTGRYLHHIAQLHIIGRYAMAALFIALAVMTALSGL